MEPLLFIDVVLVGVELAKLMAFKLLDMAQQRWRRLDGAQLLPLVRAGVKFVDGVQTENGNGSAIRLNDNSRNEAA
jgi:hypothetical protein